MICYRLSVVTCITCKLLIPIWVHFTMPNIYIPYSLYTVFLIHWIGIQRFYATIPPIKLFQASSCIRLLDGVWTDISRTFSVFSCHKIFRLYITLPVIDRILSWASFLYLWNEVSIYETDSDNMVMSACHMMHVITPEQQVFFKW